MVYKDVTRFISGICEGLGSWNRRVGMIHIVQIRTPTDAIRLDLAKLLSFRSLSSTFIAVSFSFKCFHHVSSLLSSSKPVFWSESCVQWKVAGRETKQ